MNIHKSFLVLIFDRNYILLMHNGFQLLWNKDKNALYYLFTMKKTMTPLVKFKPAYAESADWSLVTRIVALFDRGRLPTNADFADLERPAWYSAGLGFFSSMADSSQLYDVMRWKMWCLLINRQIHWLYAMVKQNYICPCNFLLDYETF